MDNNWIANAIERDIAYDEGFSAGKNMVLDDVEDILDTCANYSGEALVRELKVLLKNYGRKQS